MRMRSKSPPHDRCLVRSRILTLVVQKACGFGVHTWRPADPYVFSVCIFSLWPANTKDRAHRQASMFLKPGRRLARRRCWYEGKGGFFLV